MLDVYSDFNAWLPLVAPEAIVAFHDYDPIDRGGLRHLAVKVVLDAIIALNLLSDVSHEGRMLYGKIRSQVSLSPRACVDSWNSLHERMTRLHAALVGAGGQFAGCLPIIAAGVHPAGRVKHSGEMTTVLDATRSYSGSERTTDESRLLIDDVMLCYLLADGLATKHNLLLASCRNRKKFFKYQELIQMLGHFAEGVPGSGAARLKDAALGTWEHTFSVPPETPIETLSELAAKETLRLELLYELAGAFAE